MTNDKDPMTNECQMPKLKTNNPDPTKIEILKGL